MFATRGYLLCLAYIFGLLLVGIDGNTWCISSGAIALVFSCIASVSLLPRIWHRGPKTRFWIIAAFISSVAFVYLLLRTPHPGLNDLSLWQQRIQPDAVVTAYGRIHEEPRLTRNQRVRFVLNVDRASVPDFSDKVIQQTGETESLTGKVYITVPLLQGTGLHPGQTVAVTGSLYLPDPAQSPGGFDFRAYLARDGIFSGMQGEQITVLSESVPILWHLRQRMVRTIVQRLGTPNGTLLSAMILGRRAIDLPHQIRDEFTQAGLAHTIAASGFHISLLLGVIVWLTQRCVPRTQCLIGTAILLVYIGLTGAQASVIRAGLMGFGALYGSTLERKSKPVAMLLLIATTMLIVNPLWVYDLGFQLSFLATLGLLVLSPAIINLLDWMPKGIATLIAIPLAASIWTIPIQLVNFGAVPTYSILLNVLVTPLISVISLVGMISAAIALFMPVLGGWIAWCLQIPITVLIEFVEWWNQLPGNLFTTGHITLVQIIAIYGIYCLVWWHGWWQRHWWLALASTGTLVLVPMIIVQISRQQVTVLATSDAPAIVVQDHRQTGLIFGGTDSEAAYTVLPFLRSQGIHHLSWAILLNAGSPNTGWVRIINTLGIQTLYRLDESDTKPLTQPTFSSPTQKMEGTTTNKSQIQVFGVAKLPQGLRIYPGQDFRAGRHRAQFLKSSPTILRVQLGENWWMMCDRRQSQEPAPMFEPGTADFVWWPGGEMDVSWIEALKPKVAIAPVLKGDIHTHGDTPETLTNRIIQVYQIENVGALQWTPEQGMKPTITESIDF